MSDMHFCCQLLRTRLRETPKRLVVFCFFLPLPHGTGLLVGFYDLSTTGPKSGHLGPFPHRFSLSLLEVHLPHLQRPPYLAVLIALVSVDSAW